MVSIIIVLALAAAAFVALSLRKKSSHDGVKTSGPVNPIVVENAIPEPVVFTPEVVESVATPEQKATRKANAAKQGAAKQNATKKTVTKKTVVKKTK
jgi:flagellar basal body-associated protein FliL